MVDAFVIDVINQGATGDGLKDAAKVAGTEMGHARQIVQGQDRRLVEAVKNSRTNELSLRGVTSASSPCLSFIKDLTFKMNPGPPCGSPGIIGDRYIHGTFFYTT